MELSLDTIALEREYIHKNGGIDLSNISHVDNPKAYTKHVPFFFGRLHDWRSVRKVASRYPDIRQPCSMEVGTAAELHQHMLNGYEIAHFTYIMGKGHDKEYPHRFCGRSGRSVMLSLLEKGYPNAMYAYSRKHDHGYTILPFLLDGNGGSIVIDPTSDQCSDARNSVFVKEGNKWEYKTRWRKGADLFPDAMTSVDLLRRIAKTQSWYIYHFDGEKTLERAFSNPIEN